MAWYCIGWHGMASEAWDGLDGMRWHGMAWYCIRWLGWHGMAWYCIGWHGMVLHWMAWTKQQFPSPSTLFDSRPRPDKFLAKIFVFITSSTSCWSIPSLYIMFRSPFGCNNGTSNTLNQWFWLVTSICLSTRCISFECLSMASATLAWQKSSIESPTNTTGDWICLCSLLSFNVSSWEWFWAQTFVEAV